MDDVASVSREVVASGSGTPYLQLAEHVPVKLSQSRAVVQGRVDLESGQGRSIPSRRSAEVTDVPRLLVAGSALSQYVGCMGG